MKKNVKELLISLFGTIALCGVCGCESDPTKDPELKDKKLIYMGAYDGGWGTEWLTKAASNFEAMYPEYKVLIDVSKKYSANDLYGSIDVVKQDMFYGGLFLYDYVENDKLLDVTDVVTTPLNEYLSDSQVPVSETKTIQSKMWEDMDGYYQSYEKGHYYATPFGGGFYSISYDVDLFNEKRLFKDKQGAWSNLSGDLSLGQDGIAGTYDDGLPVTYEEFTALLERMKKLNVTPFTWSSINGYTQHFCHAMATAQDGAEAFNTFKFMDGEYTFEGDSKPTKITPANAYLLRNTIGKKDALQFAYDIISGGYYDSQAGNASMDYLTAQDTYLMSVENSKTSSSKPIAFFIDGGHWYNEAKSTLEEMAEMSDDYVNRKHGIMPFPWFSNAKATKSTNFISSTNSALFIKKGANEVEGCKKFLAYLNSDEALVLSTKTCGILRFMNYEMSDEDLASMPYYYQTQWQASKVGDVCYNLCNNPYIYRNVSYFDEMGWEWSCTTSTGSTLNNPLNNFKNNSSLTVQTYFSALLETGKNDWRTIYNED